MTWNRQRVAELLGKMGFKKEGDSWKRGDGQGVTVKAVKEAPGKVGESLLELLAQDKQAKRAGNHQKQVQETPTTPEPTTETPEDESPSEGNFGDLTEHLYDDVHRED